MAFCAAAALTAGLLVTALPFSAATSSAFAQSISQPTTAPIPGFDTTLQQIRDLLDRGRGIEAENLARALLTHAEQARGSDALEVAEVLDLLERAVRRSPRITQEEKRQIAERAAAIRERVQGPWHPDLALSLTNVGIERTIAGKPAEAEPFLRRALEIRERALGPNALPVAATLQSLAAVRMTLRDDEGAEALLERALTIREAYFGPAHLDTIQSLFKMAVFHTEVGAFTKARARMERALSLAEANLGPRQPLTLDILLRLSPLLSDGFGNYADAVKLDQRALSAAENLFGAADQRLRYPLHNLALDLKNGGHYAEARAAAERSLAIAERTLDARDPEVAASLHVLAQVLAAEGDYGQAMALFERATRINEERLRPANPEVSRASWLIPELFPLSGYDSEDVLLFEQAVAVREKIGGLTDPRTAEALTNLASSLSSAEDIRKTLPLFERALSSSEQVLGANHPETAAASSNLADVLSRSGNDAAAELLYQRALATWRQSLGEDHPRVATSLVKIATLPANRGDFADAAPLLGQALAIQRTTLGEDHPAVAETRSRLASVLGHTGAVNEAFEEAAAAEEILREHVRLTAGSLSERQAVAYVAARTSTLDLMLSLAVQSPEPERSAVAWDRVIRARATVFDELAARLRIATTTSDPEIQALTSAIARARQQLAAAVVRGPGDEPLQRYRRSLNEARNEKERAERDLVASNASFRASQSKERAGFRDLAALLTPEEALVGYIKYRRHTFNQPSAWGSGELSYAVFVVKGGAPTPALVDLGSAARIERQLSQWRRQFNYETMGTRSAAIRAETSYRQAGLLLRHQIWDPLLPYISRTKQILIVTDDALSLVSYGALPSSTSYLAETGPLIHYLSTERDLVRTGSEPVGKGLFALGGPAFDETLPAKVSQAAFRGLRPGCTEFKSMTFAPLPAAGKEVEDIATLWMKSPGTRGEASWLEGSSATESAFKASASGHRVLHLATHGFFLGGGCSSAGTAQSEARLASKITSENPLLLSGLALAGANHKEAAGDGSDDGVLTAEEVTALNLTGVQWAVLSGCDTGHGETRIGEGVFGLRRAFQLAGAQTVLMSLWSVDDESTRQWMRALYQGRLQRNLSTAESVREASLAILRDRRARGLSTHPIYWGGFIATGDWH